MIYRFLCVILILFFCNQTTVSAQFWSRTNPGAGGWMMGVGAGPTGTILVGSDLSGAYRSNDGGSSWDVIGARQGLSATHVGCVGFDPQDGNILYLGTNRGIYRSEDNGETVTHVWDTGPGAKAIGDIKFSSSNPMIGYATYQPSFNSLDGEVYKSIDRGLTWTKVSQDLSDSLRLLKLIIHPTNPDIIFMVSGKDRFACGPAELYKSDNGGVNWNKLGADVIEDFQVMDAAIDPQNPNIVYLTTMNVACGDSLAYEGKLYKSLDGGDNWFDPNPEISRRSGVIWIDKENPNIIKLIDVRKTAPWIPTSGTFTSTDGGTSWLQTGDEIDWEVGYVEEFDSDFENVIHRSFGSNGAYCKTLGEDLSDSDNRYWVNTRFVFGTRDGGEHFQNLFTNEINPGSWQSTGVDNVIIYDMEISEANPNLIFAGFADSGLWRSIDGGLSWENCNDPQFTDGWNGYGGNSFCMRTDPTREKVVWAVLRGTGNAYLVRSDNAGEISSWELSNAGLPISTLITDIAIDPNSPELNRTLFCIVSGDIYKSIDDGKTWSISGAMGGLSFTEVDPYNANIVYAGGSNGFYKSTDAGLNWDDTSHPEMKEANNTASFFRHTYRGVSCIHPSLVDSGYVFVTAFGPNKGLYKSEDHGGNWIKVHTGNHVRTVLESEINQEYIFLGSSFAGYSGGFAQPNFKAMELSDDGGETWSDLDVELTYPSVFDLESNHIFPEKVFLISQGTGMQWAFDWLLPNTYYRDMDEDQYGNADVSFSTPASTPPAGFVLDSTDCDDSNPAINPGVMEINNNGIDEDCDGTDLITAVADIGIGKKLKLWPNPSNGLINLSWEDQGEVNILVTNILSEIAFTKDNILHSNIQLDVESLSVGLYYLQIYDAKGQLLHLKPFIKI